MTDHLISAHGGTLLDLVVDPDRSEQIRSASSEWPSWDLTPRQVCDLELLLSGGFSPLRGFMGREDYEAVCDGLRLADGTIWPIPITLDVPDELAATCAGGTSLALRDAEGVMLAALQVDEVWQPDLTAEAQKVFGTVDPKHPGVDHLLNRSHRNYLGGRLEGLQMPLHYDYRELRDTPAELRERVPQAGLAPGRRLPDPQPPAPRPPGADAARRQGGGGQPAHPPRGGHDQAG